LQQFRPLLRREGSRSGPSGVPEDDMKALMTLQKKSWPSVTNRSAILLKLKPSHIKNNHLK
jgi:hypothetical protein